MIKTLVEWNLYKRPLVWGAIYLGTILLFALSYLLVPCTEWGGSEKITSFLDSLYFSVVTITSLGFGDTFLVSGSPYRVLVIVEAIIGILIIGFFLNDIAMSQTRYFDTKNKEKEETRRHQEALTRVRMYFGVITPVIEKYLRGVYEVTTPMDERYKKLPNDIMLYDFSFEMKDICDLYKESILMTNGFKEPAIVIYFRNQDALYEELRMFATTADLKDWPELEKALFRFISLHQQFQFKEAILSNMKTYLGTGVDQVKFTEHLSQAIREHDGNLRFRSGNAMTPYEVLFSSLKENVNAIKEVHRLIKEVSYNN